MSQVISKANRAYKGATWPLLQSFPWQSLCSQSIPTPPVSSPAIIQSVSDLIVLPFQSFALLYASCSYTMYMVPCLPCRSIILFEELIHHLHVLNAVVLLWQSSFICNDSYSFILSDKWALVVYSFSLWIITAVDIFAHNICGYYVFSSSWEDHEWQVIW